jgi:hypothetical protein
VRDGLRGFFFAFAAGFFRAMVVSFAHIIAESALSGADFVAEAGAASKGLHFFVRAAGGGGAARADEWRVETEILEVSARIDVEIDQALADFALRIGRRKFELLLRGCQCGAVGRFAGAGFHVTPIALHLSEPSYGVGAIGLPFGRFLACM